MYQIMYYVIVENLYYHLYYLNLYYLYYHLNNYLYYYLNKFEKKLHIMKRELTHATIFVN